jgi:hypothetical protein
VKAVRVTTVQREKLMMLVGLGRRAVVNGATSGERLNLMGEHAVAQPRSNRRDAPLLPDVPRRVPDRFLALPE